MNLLAAFPSDTIHCSCGKIHKIQTRFVCVGNDELKNLPDIMKKSKLEGAGLLVYDCNTFEVAAREASDILGSCNIPCEKICFSGEHVHADAFHLKELQEAAQKYSPSWMIAVGSGSINDLVKLTAHRLSIPYLVIATSASMDGYLSANAAIFEDGIKKQYLNLNPPVAAIADTNVLYHAPREMTRAGLGDALGKFTSLTEWKLNHLLAGEFYCEQTAKLVEQEVQALLTAADQDSPQFFAALIKTLLITGTAMQMLGNSTPASAGEHYFSHALDTHSCAVTGDVYASHGDQVALGTWKLLKLYRALDQDHIIHPDPERYSNHIRHWQEFGIDFSEIINGKI